MAIGTLVMVGPRRQSYSPSGMRASLTMSRERRECACGGVHHRQRVGARDVCAGPKKCRHTRESRSNAPLLHAGGDTEFYRLRGFSICWISANYSQLSKFVLRFDIEIQCFLQINVGQRDSTFAPSGTDFPCARTALSRGPRIGGSRRAGGGCQGMFWIAAVCCRRRRAGPCRTGPRLRSTCNANARQRSAITVPRASPLCAACVANNIRHGGNHFFRGIRSKRRSALLGWILAAQHYGDALL